MHDLKISVLKIIWQVWVVVMFIVKAKLHFRKQLCSVLLSEAPNKCILYMPVKMLGKTE